MEKILVADDELDIRDVMQRLLSREGYTVFSAQDGAEALNIAREQKPDLIILDFVMPGLNGIEVCQVLQKDEATKHIPVIIVTAYSNQKEEALRAGAVDFMNKGADQIDILWRVRSVLKVRNISNELQRMIAYIGELEKKTPKV